MLAWLVHVAEYLVPFVLVLSVLVFFHELGHYLVARYNGVKVEVFSIGFGHEVFGWNDRVGTRWKISWLPLGGYVKMWGDENAASTPHHQALKKMSATDRAQSLHAKTVWQRMAVSAAGPFANYLLAFLLFAGLFMTEGYRYTAPVIGGVVSDSPALKAGFQVNDKILSVDATSVQRFEDIVSYVRARPGQSLDFEIERDGHKLSLQATPDGSPVKPLIGQSRTIGLLGIQGKEMVLERKAPLQAIGLAFQELWSISWQTVAGVVQMLLGQRSMDGMGGPLMIAQLSGEIAHSGMVALLWFMALLSVNLGLVNLFPIPLLDGGHLFLYSIEAVRGKPLSERALEWCYRLGLAVVLSLLFLTTWNDLKRLHFFQLIIDWFA